MTTVTHPLEMLTGDEIKRAVEILRASGRVPEGALFAHIVLHEPHKDELAQWKPGDPVERARARASSCPAPSMDLHEVVVSVTTGDDRRVARPSTTCARRLLMTEAIGAIFTTKEHPDYIAALAKRGHHRPRPRADRPVAGRRVRLRRARRAAASPAASRSCASDPTDNGYARPIEGADRALRHGPQRGDRGRSTTASPRCRRTAASYYAEDQPRLRDGPEADLDHPARGPELHRRRQPRASGRSGRSASAFDPYEGLVLHQVALRRRRPHALDPAPRVDLARWSCPTATPASCTAGRTRSTPASGASAA